MSLSSAAATREATASARSAVRGPARSDLIDVGSEPPEHENKAETWPNWPRKMRISTSHEEGCEKLFQVSTKEIVKDKKGEVTAIRCVKVKVDRGPDGRLRFQDIPGTEFEIPVQRVYLAMGFLHPSSDRARRLWG